MTDCIRIPQVPIYCNVLYENRDEALNAPKGDIDLCFCESCGHLFNSAFDPSHVPGRQARDAELTFIRDYYSEAYRSYRADLICCRHALEHISRPYDFLCTLRDSIGDHPTAVFFEVPKALFTLRDLAIWDLIYEHCGYFTEHSLRQVFRRSGFSVTNIGSEFGGQFLGIHASPEVSGAVCTGESHEPPAESREMVRRFSRHYQAKVENWRDTLQGLRREGLRTALWGAGSKGVSFTNILRADEEIGCLIDLNPPQTGPLCAWNRPPGPLTRLSRGVQTGGRHHNEPTVYRGDQAKPG